MLTTTRNHRKPINPPKKIKNYKKHINHLIAETLNGNSVAEASLSQELSNNPLARKVTEKEIKKRQKYVQKPGETGVRGERPKIIFGNGFRPYQGGSPGGGKRS